MQWANATQTLSRGHKVPETYKLVPDWDPETDAPVSNGNGVIDCTRCGGRIGFYLASMDAICLTTGSFAREEGGKNKGWDVIKPQFHMFYNDEGG